MPAQDSPPRSSWLALRALAIDPIGFLIAPRFVAFVTTLFLATLYADALALFGAAYA